MLNWNILKIQGSLSEEFTRNFKWQWNTLYVNHRNGVDKSLIKPITEDSVCSNQAFNEE